MFKPLPIGLRRSRVQLLARNNDQDSFGQATGYTSYATVAAYITAASASEVYKAEQYTSEVSHVVNIRWSASLSVKSKDRVLLGSQTFDIKAVVNPDQPDR